MARAKRKSKKRTEVVDKDDDSNDELNIPDPESEEFFYDDVDKFHNNRQQILLEKSGISSEEEANEGEQIEEVLGLDIDSDIEEDEEEKEDEDENEEFEEDEEEKEDDNEEFEEENLSSDESDIEKGIPNEKAWGKKKKIYYDADDQNENDLDSEEEEALDKEEELEALALQQQMAERLDENDFDVEEFDLTESESVDKQKAKDEEGKQEKIIKDLSKLSKEEKIKLLAKDSPELFPLINDFKEKLSEVINCLQPLVQMARSGKITNPQGIEYLEMKQQLILNYLVNISFYLLLKAHQSSVKNHPVIERLVQYRELLQKLEPLDVQLQDEMEHFLNLHKENEENQANSPMEEKAKAKKVNSKKTVKFLKSEDISKPEHGESSSNVTTAGSKKKRKIPEETDPLIYYEAVKQMKKKKKEDRIKAHILSKEGTMEEVEEEDMDGKRSITYQIFKNKGLTPKRKKELRNPRIKHRKKFQKAKIRHKSQVLPVVKEHTRYGGESTGIRTHLTRSIKIK